MKSVLVIRPGALGDAVLTLPALARLRHNGVERINLLGTKANWAFLNPEADDLRVFDFGSAAWLGLFSDAPLQAREQALLAECAAAVVYAKDADVLTRRLRAAGISAIQVIEPPTATERSESGIRKLHAAMRMCDSQGFAALSLKVEADLAQEEQIITQWLGTGRTEEARYFALHPGSGGKRKCWAAPRFAELIRQLQERSGLKALVLFGEADTHLRQAFDFLPPEQVAVDRSLREVLGLLRGASFYVGNDSGISHLAARVTRSLAIFGPTDPEVWAPLGPVSRTVLAPRGDLDKLTVDAVLGSLQDWL